MEIFDDYHKNYNEIDNDNDIYIENDNNDNDLDDKGIIDNFDNDDNSIDFKNINIININILLKMLKKMIFQLFC